MGRATRGLAVALLLGGALAATGCGSDGSASTETGALANLRSTLTTYDEATPTDVASTGSACEQALTALKQSSLLAATPTPGKELAVREDLHAAFVQAQLGFSDCASGAKGMDFRAMARGDAELAAANEDLRRSQAPSG